MKKTIISLLFLLLMSINSQAQNQETRMDTSRNDQLIGEWLIDLRPTPQSEGYFQDFVVISISDNRFTGTFYGSSLEQGLINNKWDKLYFAFSTKDQSNVYYHSGYLLDDKLFGMTYCPDRQFTAPWTGKRKN